MTKFIEDAEKRRELHTMFAHTDELRERAVIAAERQAAALERIAAALEGVAYADNLDESVKIWGSNDLGERTG